MRNSCNHTHNYTTHVHSLMSCIHKDNHTSVVNDRHLQQQNRPQQQMICGEKKREKEKKKKPTGIESLCVSLSVSVCHCLCLCLCLCLRLSVCLFPEGRDWQVKASGRSTYSTLPLLELLSLIVTSGLSFTSVQRQALIGWWMQLICLEYIMLCLERTGRNRCSEPFQP